MSASHSPAAAALNPGYSRCTTPGSLNSYSAKVNTAGLSAGRHKIVLRAKTAFDTSASFNNAYI